MDFTYKLKEQIQNLRIKAQSIKEIAVRLGFSQGYEIREVEKAVRQMCADGTLVEISEGRFSAPQRENAVIGKLRGNRRGFAFLIREDGGEDLFIPHHALNGAMHADTVYAKIVKGDEAEVVSIVSRGITRLVGRIQREKEFAFLIPDDPNYYADPYIPFKELKNVPDHSKVVAEITRYRQGKNPEAKILEVIGDASEKRSAVLSILKSYGFEEKFPEKVLAEAEKAKYTSVDGKRTDLRDLLTITIDGDDSKDLDDAISLNRKGDRYELYVHIADVSHYVRRGSLLDQEALSRATSVYFPGSVYPMLPPVLSNGICSLNAGEDRLALSVRIELNAAGDVLDSEILESIIRNDHRMTYHDVTAMIEGDQALLKTYAKAAPMITEMHKLALALMRQKEARGSIDFETSESKILLDEAGDVAEIVRYEVSISNQIIEEFMVLANRVVAETFFHLQLPFVYRVHEKPDPEKMRDFALFAKGCGLPLTTKEIHPKVLQELLAEARKTPYERIISKVMLRSMQKARYTTECLGHFGLSLTYYCHFTSPIRRYPDLMIHRVIKMMLQGKLQSDIISKLEAECETAAEISSKRERDSESAERDIDDFYKAEYMAKHIGEQFDGIVSGVTSFGVFVELENSCEGLARLQDLPKDKYEFVENRYLLKGTKHSYSLGQAVKIKVLAASTESKRVDFEIIEE